MMTQGVTRAMARQQVLIPVNKCCPGKSILYPTRMGGGTWMGGWSSQILGEGLQAGNLLWFSLTCLIAKNRRDPEQPP